MCRRAKASATRVETLRNLVRSTVFLLFLVRLFTSLENWCRNVPLASVTCEQRGLGFAKPFSLDRIALPSDHCALKWEQGHANVGVGNEARNLSIGTQQSQSSTAPSAAALGYLITSLSIFCRVPTVRTHIWRPRSSHFRKILSGKTPPGLSLLMNLLQRCVFPSSEILHTGLEETILCSGLAWGLQH